MAELLSGEPDMCVVGQGASAAEAVDLATTCRPTLVLLDLDMPGGGINALRAIQQASPLVKAVVLTVSASEDDLLAAFQAGASGYILKGVSARQLTGILRAVATGGSYAPQPFTALLANDRVTKM